MLRDIARIAASAIIESKRRMKKMTNRDKINGMSNARLADMLSRVDMADNIRCKFCILRAENCILSGLSCFDGIKAWLDAPVKNPEKTACRQQS